MATFTQNYNLKKPDQQDFYNVEDFNNNADIIDEQLKEMANGLGSAAQESTVSSINTKIGETGNTGGTSSSGSLFAKLNKTITDVSSLNTLIGQANNTGGSATAGSVFAKLNKLISDVTTHMGRWTATRAGYIDTINTNAASAKTAATNAQNYTVTNNTANKTGILSQKIAYVISLLENTTYGLNALKKATTNSDGVKPSLTGTGTTIYSSTTTLSGNIYAIDMIIIAKFIAPVSGMYRITMNDTSGARNYLWKSGFTSPISITNGSNYISCGRYDPYYIYNKVSVGENSNYGYMCFSANNSALAYTINDNNYGDLFSCAKYIGYTTTSINNFYCLAGEPVVIAIGGYGGSGSGYSVYNISNVVVTYQTR